MNNKLATGVALLALLVALGVGFLKPNVVVDVSPLSNVIEDVVERLGAVASPVLTSPFFQVNGVREWSYSEAFTTASTTACSFRTPQNSTTTLVYASLKVTTATTTATQWEFGKNNTTFDATTTRLGLVLVPTSVQITAVASTSPSNATQDSDLQFAPGAYLNIKWIANGVPSCTANCTTMVGLCKAKFIEN